jgi:hypothetical protein
MKKNLIIVLGTGMVMLSAATIVFLRILPIGAMCIPYCIASVDEGHTVPGMPWKIVYNDAGGAHSGNFWTWVLEDRGLYRIVVAQGYSTADVRYGRSPLPAKLEGGAIYLGFTRHRYLDQQEWARVDTELPSTGLVVPEVPQESLIIPQSSEAPLEWFLEAGAVIDSTPSDAEQVVSPYGP